MRISRYAFFVCFLVYDNYNAATRNTINNIYNIVTKHTAALMFKRGCVIVIVLFNLN